MGDISRQCHLPASLNLFWAAFHAWESTNPSTLLQDSGTANIFSEPDVKQKRSGGNKVRQGELPAR
jgi:hypothetical protein